MGSIIAVVFTPPKNRVALNDHFQWWSYLASANWRHPEGPGSDIKSRMNHPVVHIAFDDVVAYCKWAVKRLPTEAEFEFASRGGLDRKRYDWGDERSPGGKTMANTFQGHFPDTNTGEDGYKETAPVGLFPANGFGLVDMSGNVWEWTSDWVLGPTTTRGWQPAAKWPRIPGDRLTALIRASREELSVFIAAGRICAPINIAAVISLVDAAKASPIRGPII